ncbi:MAG: radical SAM protein [Thermoanaerobacterales bacterium]|nr:radical SAM protein [Thermoanaerobacterales bacterium]
MHLTPDELAARAEEAGSLLSECCLCGHECRIDRLGGEKGVCGAGDLAVISGYGPHFGEESVLVGTGGSGTIFFSRCNLRCVFCQNWEISALGEGDPVTPEELAEIMLDLQRQGCHNINLVSPTHYVPQILEALSLAAGKGLDLPIVYNTGGYDHLDTLKVLDGVIAIYMPDIKFGDDETARRYTGVKDYFTVAKKAVKEMHRQVGDLVVDEHGIAVRGLLVRHLVLPNGLAGTETVMEFLANEVSPRTYINIMDQYYPAYFAHRYPELSRRVTGAEYLEALRATRKASPHFRLAD